MSLKTYIYLIACVTLISCSEQEKTTDPGILFNQGGYPFATEHEGTYYYTMQTPGCDSIILYTSPDIESLTSARQKIVFTYADLNMHNFYSPELHRINGKWYIYFEADNGNSDNHQLFVLENPSENPMQGEWTAHGPIITNDEWNFGIHPTSPTVGQKQFLLWSGWPKRRLESETQCIFIAEMENPWTLKSRRVMISMPQYEWERQWINPDGSRSAYPIFVNENPQAFISPDNRNVVVAYSASGIWTVFNTLGLLYAPIGSDLLDPKSWTKLPEPQFIPDHNSGIFGTSNVSIVASHSKDRQYLLYQAKHNDSTGNIVNDIRMKEISWSERGLPVFRQP